MFTCASDHQTVLAREFVLVVEGMIKRVDGMLERGMERLLEGTCRHGHHARAGYRQALIDADGYGLRVTQPSSNLPGDSPGSATGRDADIEAISLATDTLLDTIRELDDPAVGAPSRCRGWTRAHVLSHVARNADALGQLMQKLGTTEPTSMYPSPQEREEAIAAGTRMRASELEGDVESSAERFLAVCAKTATPVMDSKVLLRDGRRLSGHDVLWARLREVVMHHVDLDAGFTFADAGAPFVARCLEHTMAAFEARDDVPGLRIVALDLPRSWQVGDGAAEVSGDAHVLLAWLTGRGGDGLTVDGLVDDGGSLPRLPDWG